MPTIHFTANDVAKVRLTTTLGLFSETVFALSSLDHFPVWGPLGLPRTLSLELRRQSSSIEQLGATPSNDLLWLFDRTAGADGTAARDRAALRRQVTEAVTQTGQTVLLPYWPTIRGHLAAERDARGRSVITGGVDRLLSTLHARVNWHDTVLEVPGEAREIRLDGRGILLVPSLFLLSRPAVFIDGDRPGGTPVLAFSAPLHPAHPAPSSHNHDGTSLAALIGQTRAAALGTLLEACTTSELAKRLGISSACASQHTGVLRHSGLIRTDRNRNTVLHTVTALGRALLDGELASPPEAAD